MKAREWWIEHKNILGGYWEAYEKSGPGLIHVIEYSTYAELKEQAEKLAAALSIAALGETQWDGVEAMHAARKSLAEYERFKEGK